MLRSSSPRALYLATAIGLAYLALGVLWILGSDWPVATVSQDAGWLAWAQRWKGLSYVGLTALGLVVLIYVGYVRLEAVNEKVRRRELQVEDLFLHHPTPMWVFERGTLRFLAVNEAAVAVYGYTRAEFLRMTLRDIRHPEDAAHFERQRAERDHEPKVVSAWRHRRKDGAFLHARVTRHNLTFRGVPAGLVMADDVTASALAQAELAEQELRMRHLHEGLQEVLWLSDAAGRRMVYVSPAFQVLCGRPAQDLMVDPDLWRELVHPQDIAGFRAMARQVVEQGHAQGEYRVVHADGSVRWVADRRRRVLDARGTVLYVAGIMEDISAAKAHQAALQRWNETLEQQVVVRTADLRLVIDELDAFARTAAHDLKTPLNAVSGFVQILGMRYGDGLGQDGQQLVARIDQSARMMAALVDDLLRLSRVTTHELRIETVDLAAMAREILAQLQARDPQRVAVCTVPDQILARGDPGLVRPLLVNLLDNAWKYASKEAETRIEFGCTGGANGSVYFVSDNGVGFDGHEAGQLFKPFHRLHSAKDFSGTGVGLATCQRIVRRHGGDIWLTSSPGAGTTVFFTLERIQADGAERAA